MAESWEDKRKGWKNISLIISLCIAVILAGFLVFNNIAPFRGDDNVIDSVTVGDSVKAPQEEEPSEWIEREKSEGVVEQAEDNKETPETAELKKEPEKKKIKEAASMEESLFSLDLPSVKCALADKKGLFIQLTLKVYFKKKELEKEILFKRDNIKVVVKKALFNKSLSEVVVENLRMELKKEINSLLEKGKIEDIEFIDFRPVEDM